MQYGFYFDQSRCIGCNACTVACKDWNDINPGPIRWRKQQTYEEKNGNTVFENLSMSCNHCEKPACIDACAANAIKKTAEGIVIVDRTICVGAGSCIDACPFSAPHRAVKSNSESNNDEDQEPVKRSEWQTDHPMQKCKYCYERVVKDGQSPVCVAACPVHALDWGDIKKFENMADVVRMNPTDFPYAYKKDKMNVDTKPSFFIKRRRKLEVK